MGEKMKQDLAQRDTKLEQDLAQISSQMCQMEQDLAQRDTKMKQELAQLNANIEKIEKANAMVVQELFSRFEQLLGGPGATIERRLYCTWPTTRWTICNQKQIVHHHFAKFCAQQAQ